MSAYPNSSVEFRIYKTINGDAILQVRYICEAQGYTSKWQAIPVVEESLLAEQTSTTI
jgi:hypothetical protein